MKKLFVTLLTVIMTLSLCALAACVKDSETNTPPSTPAYFTVEGSTITGVTLDGRKQETLVVPEAVDGVTITAIGNDAFSGSEKVKNVQLPDTITTIGDKAFYECKNLTQINLPSGINSIGVSAFTSCSKLQSIDIPTGISEIPNETFRECRSLNNVTIPSNITKIGEKAFEKCIAFTKIHLPASVSTLSNDAFTNCNSVTEFSVDSNSQYFRTIDGNLYSKDGKTFVYYALGKTDKTFTVPEGVVTLGWAAFANEMELETVNVATTVQSLGYECFSACQGLKYITFGGWDSSLTTINHRAFFNCVQLYSIEAPESLNYIGRFAFSYCSRVGKVYSYKAAADWDSIDVSRVASDGNLVYLNESIREYM